MQAKRTPQRRASAPLRARSMLFTLYGDYVYPKRDALWLGTLVRVGEQLGLSEVAVRSAVARLTRQGWLIARRRGSRSFYRLSARGRSLIAEGTRRIYRTNGHRWDGRWSLLVYSIPESVRATRDRLRTRLAFLGFGALGGGVYLAARDVHADARRLLQSHDALHFARLFRAQIDGGVGDAQLARECWDLDFIARAYEGFLKRYEPLLRRDRSLKRRGKLGDDAAFATRFMLTHDYRRFPFIDPDLPEELLPRRWAGSRARGLFDEYHGVLTEGAQRFFASVKAAASSG